MNQFNDAKSAFDNGYNCAQSVLTPFASQMNIDVETVLKLSSGFGAGMGRLQKTCGAITGAYMVIGLKYGKQESDESKEKVNNLIQEFTRKFRQEHKFTNCRELLNCDLKTEEGQLYFEQHNLQERVCSKCVGNAVSILEDLID